MLKICGSIFAGVISHIIVDLDFTTRDDIFLDAVHFGFHFRRDQLGVIFILRPIYTTFKPNPVLSHRQSIYLADSFQLWNAAKPTLFTIEVSIVPGANGFGWNQHRLPAYPHLSRLDIRLNRYRQRQHKQHLHL